MDQFARIEFGLDRLLSLNVAARSRLDDEFGSAVGGDIGLGRRRSADEIEAVGASIGTTLPADYVRFLSEIGDGGVGPGRTFHSLEESCPSHVHPEQAFNVQEPIVDQSDGNFPPEIAVVERVSDHWQGEGVIELSDYGCSMTAILIVNGDRSGEMWFHEPSVVALTPWCYCSVLHGRIDDIDGGAPGFRPAKPYSFLDWYEEWLTALLAFE